MPDTVLPVVPGVHWRDPRCFVWRFSVTRSEAAWEVPVGPPGQPRSRRSGRLGFWGVPPFLALFESEALAVHFQDVDMVGQAIQQGSGQAFGTEDFRPFIERQIGGDDHRASLVALREPPERPFKPAVDPGVGIR